MLKHINSIKIGFPDGNGVLGNYEFWEEYCKAAKLTIIDGSHDLKELQNISHQYFPTRICLASKYRLGRAVLLAPHVDYLLFFLHNDKFVFNCPNSVYRIKWLKAYLERENISTKVLTWPFDFTPDADLKTNILSLTKTLGGNNLGVIQFISKYNQFPERMPKYHLGLTNDKKNILLIGKIPFILDPFRQTKLMDRLTNKFGVTMPHLILDNDTSILEEKSFNVIFYKEKSILLAIDKAVESGNLHGVILAADPFDIPGNYTFPIIKKHLDNIKIRYVHIKPTLNNCDSKIESIIESIEKMVGNSYMKK
ncbi:hypothetical protein [Parabacteroides goldsteinii]|uniref:hypothetical protein n=1 Tax=Parabacteroides goldsteinii TaxID=328812 RepID=UPI001D4146F6|nr:hypothetical protein [Parabacteroides goldsteinii]MBS6574743.1 hypothetical protein [Parabacteroides goldsteinii]